MEFSSPFTTNSSKLSAITDFLFLRKTSQALYNGMMKNRRATDPRNGIQMAASCLSGILKKHVPLTNGDQIPGVHPWGLKRSFPSPNNVHTPRAKKNCQKCTIPRVLLGVPRGCPRGQRPGKPMISALPAEHINCDLRNCILIYNLS